MMESNGHDFISDVPLSGFMKMFYKQGFKVQGMLLFYFLQQAVSERARAVFYSRMGLWRKSCSGCRKEHTSPNAEG